MSRAAIVARWFAIPLVLAAAIACRPSQSAPAPQAPTADVSGTVAAQVKATVQTLSETRNSAPATPAPSAPTAIAPSLTQAVPVVNLPIVLDEHFATPPQGWPDDAAGVGWHADGAYHLAAR